MLNLDSVDIVCVDCVDVKRAEDALIKSQKEIAFHSCQLLTDKTCNRPRVDRTLIKTIGNLQEYSNFIIKELVHYVTAEYVLIVQHDGYILNPHAWNDEFLQCDYIGAPWYWSNYLVGNGGFSLRSRKLHEFLSKTIHSNIEVAEDWFICYVLRDVLMKKGFQFADPLLAMKFSTETYPQYTNQFGWHGIRNPQSDVVRQ